jgi:hypothetical protein
MTTGRTSVIPPISGTGCPPVTSPPMMPVFGNADRPSLHHTNPIAIPSLLGTAHENSVAPNNGTNGSSSVAGHSAHEAKWMVSWRARGSGYITA